MASTATASSWALCTLLLSALEVHLAMDWHDPPHAVSGMACSVKKVYLSWSLLMPVMRVSCAGIKPCVSSFGAGRPTCCPVLGAVPLCR